MDKHPLSIIPRVLLFLALLAAFIVLEIFTYSYREQGILKKKAVHEQTQQVRNKKKVENRASPVRERGGILILLTVLYLSLSTAMLYLIFHDKQFLRLGLVVHILLLVLCVTSYAAAVLLQYEKILSISRFFFSLALSPTVLIIFIASYPLFKAGKKSMA